MEGVVTSFRDFNDGPRPRWWRHPREWIAWRRCDRWFTDWAEVFSQPSHVRVLEEWTDAEIVQLVEAIYEEGDASA